VWAGGVTADVERRESEARVRAEAVADPDAGAVRREHVLVEEYHSAGAEFGLALASTGLSLLYHPVRMVVGIVGAQLGGIGGWSTGGDMRTAKGLWRPTVEGDYFIRPDHLDGTEPYHFSNVSPVVHERYSVRRVESTAVESAPAPALEADEDELDYEPDDFEDDEL
jgi:hypothetical protein